MDATDAYILDDSIGLKSITRRPTKIIPMMTNAVTQNQEKIFTKRRCTGTRSRKRNTLDLKFIDAFFSHQFRYAARLGAPANPQAGRYVPVEQQRVIIIPWAMHRDIQSRERCESSRLRLAVCQAYGVGLSCENRCCDQRRELSAKHTLNEFVACEHLSRCFEKHVQQIKFCRCQVQRLAGFRDDTRSQIEFQISGPDPGRPESVIVVGLPTGPAENGGNSCNQFTWTERFSYIIIGAKFQAQDAVEFIAFSGQHQNRSSSPLSYFSQNIKPFLVRQHDIQHY